MIGRIIRTLFLFSAPLAAAVTKVELVDRADVAGGKSWGQAGPYERIIAKARFAIDPTNSANWGIHDRERAPRNQKGLIEFSADLYVLRPRDPALGNGTLLMEVPNRGGKGMLSRFNFARSSLDPRTAEELGDGWLLEQGYTLAWVGWQWDVPSKEGLLRLDAPVVTDNGKVIRGVVRAEFLPDAKTTLMPLSDQNHLAYPAIEAPAKLTVRQAAASGRRSVPASSWKFTPERTSIEMAAGFQPGLIYELVYQAENPRLAGVGLAAVRDAASFLKYSKDGNTLLGGGGGRYVKRALAFGISQSGRFLRTFLYYGFNSDESLRKVFDGVWADVAGAGRGSFNHRFAQASRDGYAYWNNLYPTDLFPFTDVPQMEPAAHETDGLLAHEGDLSMPLIFWTNGSWEYWNRCASLVHTSFEGSLDAPLPPQTRLYVLSGSQHGPGSLPRRDKSARQLVNPNDHRPYQRALLAALEAWVRNGTEPPRSVYPMITEDQLVFPRKLKFPALAGVRPPRNPKLAWILDFGADFREKGIITIEPPKLEGSFATLVPQTDDDGIDLGGIRMPEVAEPLGTFTGWNLRSPESGSPTEMARVLGSFLPFAKTKTERLAAKDPRPSIEERYSSRDEYVARVGAAADKLIARRFLLARDRQRVLEHAGALWDWVMKGEAQ